MIRSTAQATVFYAWQSDLPAIDNLDLIEHALEAATGQLRDDPALGWAPQVDRDTRGIPGAPDVPAVILSKIDAADVCVFDLSIAIRAKGLRPCPNPNVLIELGYALKAHSPDRLLLVFNEAYGQPKSDLPFDLGYKRVVLYRADATADRDQARETLASDLRRRLAEAHVSPRREKLTEEVRRLVAVLHDKVESMRGSRGGVLLWANPDSATEYVVYTEQMQRSLVPHQPRRPVVRYDPVQFRLTHSALPEEISALEQLAAKRGVPMLPPA